MPLDCSPEDTANYLSVLTGDDAEWAALSSEIQAIAAGATAHARPSSPMGPSLRRMRRVCSFIGATVYHAHLLTAEAQSAQGKTQSESFALLQRQQPGRRHRGD